MRDIFLLFLMLIRTCACFNTETDGTKVVSVKASVGNADVNVEISYTNLKIIGSGSFGVVYQATLLDSGDVIAIKKVLQDRRFKVSTLHKKYTRHYVLRCQPPCTQMTHVNLVVKGFQWCYGRPFLLESFCFVQISIYTPPGANTMPTVYTYNI